LNATSSLLNVLFNGGGERRD